ncbi:MAG: hypothetical protein LBS62_08960 [Clostridiales bacterium]|jgi:hypothetical protein|nr:hypothetical protein [Clostridiales bacterium]
MEKILSELKAMLSDTEPVLTRNYYYENHLCPLMRQPPEAPDSLVKVPLEYKISTESDGKILKLGRCPNCGKVYIHEDYETNVL